jgi:hypothetical protein
MGRPTCESSLLELPNAKLFVKTGGVKKSALDAESRCISQTQASPEMGAGKGLKRRAFPYDPIQAP